MSKTKQNKNDKKFLNILVMCKCWLLNRLVNKYDHLLIIVLLKI